MIEGTDSQDRAVEPRSKLRLWLVVAAIGLIAIVAAVLFIPKLLRWTQAEHSVSLDRLSIGTVTREDFVRDISQPGTVVAGVSPTLYAQDGGTVVFAVEVGDEVSQDQVLARIMSPQLEFGLRQEEAAERRLGIEVNRESILQKQQRLTNERSRDLAEVALTAARREARRADLAHQQEAISDLDWEKAQDELKSAEYAYEFAVKNLALDSERMDFELSTRRLLLENQSISVEDVRQRVDALTIRSPIEGIVGRLMVNQMTNIPANAPLITVVDLSKYEIEARVPESYADDLSAGMRAEVTVRQDAYPAELIAVSPEVIENQVAVRVRFSGEQPTGLRQQQRLQTRIFLEHIPDALVINQGQFLESNSGRIAYVLDEDGLARRTAIRIGARSLRKVEILDGLELGDRIILSDITNFRNVDTVLVTQ